MQAATSHPERIAQYEIVERLAQGHSGWAFYKGFDPILRRYATLRVIPKRMLENYGPAMVARLQSDIGAAGRIHHPGIVGVYEYGEESDSAFIATEFVQTGCLKERNRVPVADAVSLAVQCLVALDFAHNQGLVHRDIRPSNLLITEKGNARIANFGMSELSAGAPAYMSPEQLTGSSVDRRSDLFSVGLILYELLTGTSPFAGSPESLLQRVCDEKERPPSEVNPQVPKSFDPVCAKALAKLAQDRYQSARALSEAIREAFENTFSSQPQRAVSNETFLTATLQRPAAEPDAAVRSRDGIKAVSPAVASKWDESVLRSIEKQLASFMGPLARIIVKEAAAKANDVEHLYALAAESLKQESDRQAFLAQRTSPSQTPVQPDPAKTPAGSAAKPAADSLPRTSPPEVKASGKPEVKPPVAAKAVPLDNKKIVPPQAVPVAKVEVGPSPKAKPEVASPAKQEVKPAIAPELKVVPRPEPVPTPVAKAPIMPAPAKVVPEPIARVEELIGKQPETLGGFLHEDPPQLEEVIHAFVASMQALIAMQSGGDRKETLTPDSICFDRLGKATIQNLQPTASRGTSSGAGNPRYAAPEIFSEKSSGTNMTGAHVYALGVMFYEILLGKRLFGKTFADQRTDLDWMRWHADLESRTPQLKSLLPDYPVALSDVVESMMEKRAEKRPTDLESIASKLRNIAQRANKTIVLDKAKAKAKQAAPVAAVKARPNKAKKGVLGWLIALVLIIALAGAGIFLWQNPDYYRTVIAPLLESTH